MDKNEIGKILQEMLEREINNISDANLRRIDEVGARIYILTNKDNQPYLKIFYGGSDLDVWTISQIKPAMSETYWECWQKIEDKAEPEDLRHNLLSNLPEMLTEKYLQSLEDCTIDSALSS